MTACVDNNQKKGRTAKAVSATLAGVLAVGMVPAAAFADTAVETEASDDAALLAGDEQVITDAVPTLVTFDTGAAISDPENIEIPYDANYNGGQLVLHSISIDGTVLSDAADADDSGEAVTFNFLGYGNYRADKSNYDPYQFTFQNISQLMDTTARIGRTFYAAFMIEGGTYGGEIYSLPFKIVSTKSLEGAKLIENGNISDTTFNWTGNAPQIGVAINDTVLDATNDYDIKYFAAGEEASDAKPMTAALLPGDYVAYVTGKAGGDYEGCEPVEIPFTVNKLNLADVTVLPNYDAFSTAAPSPTGTSASAYIAGMKINGVDVNMSGFTLTFTGTGSTTANGEYEYTLESNNKYTEGEKTITYTKVDEQVQPQNFWYAKGQFGGNFPGVNPSAPDLTTDYNYDNPNIFDENDVMVFDNSGINNADHELPFTLKVYDANYNETTIEAAQTVAGTYYVYAIVNAADTDYEFGGVSYPMLVKVVNANLGAANVIFAYDGKNMDTTAGETTEVTYDGTDLMSHIATQVTDKKGNVLTEGEDYTVEVKDENGKIVDEIVNAGTYTLTVKSGKYTFTDPDATLVVNPAPIESLDVTNLMTFGNSEFFKYTGEAITPEFAYATTSMPTASDYKALPDVYDLQIFYSESAPTYDQYGKPTNWDKTTFNKVDEIKEAGTYYLVLEPKADAEGVDNFLFTSFAPLTDSNGLVAANSPWTFVTVSDQGVFSDVPTDHWAAQYIYTASEEGYVNGYAGTSYFGPNNEILRGEAATILFRMAGGNEISSSILQQILAQPMPFSDVESGMYYTAPIIWASSAHIVNGYDSTGLFAPNGDITREEFATMLYRYAKATDQLGDAEAGDLSGYVDGASVSDWAKEAMEWATGAGIINGYGDTGVLGPQNTITRAEACKMMVELQPETLTDMFGSNTPILP